MGVIIYQIMALKVPFYEVTFSSLINLV